LRNSEMKHAMKNLWCRKLTMGRIRLYPPYWIQLLLFLNQRTCCKF
jgi:hypothetical protein